MERKPFFDWRGSTPLELGGAVSHLREQYDEAMWKINQVTRHLCFAALHPLEKVKDLLSYKRAFEQMKPIVGRAALDDFLETTKRGTVPASFAAYYRIRRLFLEAQLAYVIHEMLTLASVQRQLLSSPPAAWVNEQFQSLIDVEVWKTSNWVKEVCDVQRHNPNDRDMEEAIQWSSWRAPEFFIMEPSRFATYDPDRSWQRQDEDTTTKWLDNLIQEVTWGLEKVLKVAVGNAHLAELKREPIAVFATLGPTLPTGPFSPAARATWDQPGYRTAVRVNFDKVLKCRTGALGSEVYASCTEQKVVHHTCKSRACPSCGHRATTLWQREMWAGLPDVDFAGGGPDDAQRAFGASSARIVTSWTTCRPWVLRSSTNGPLRLTALGS
jgi:hypothetical protein